MDSDSEYNEQIRLKHYRSLQARKQQTNHEKTSKNKEQKKKRTENSFVSNKSDSNANKSSIKQEESNNTRSRPLDDPLTQQLNKIENAVSISHQHRLKLKKVTMINHCLNCQRFSTILTLL